MNRRNFLLGAGVALAAAPAIVRVASIMPVKAPPLADPDALWHILRIKLAKLEEDMARDLESYLFGEPHTSYAATARRYQWTPLVARAC